MPIQLTPAGDAAVAEIAQRYRLSHGAVRSMMDSVARGGGGMAQFSIPELGGNGQWMRGGMTMVGDMFNSGLQSTVSNLCMELSTLLAAGEVLVGPATGSAGGRMTGMMPFGNAWWPQDLGRPSSTGGQNDSAYAYFPGTRRLAIRHAGRITLYDTGDHSISGVQQQQGGYGTLEFTSQYGTFTVDTLEVVDGTRSGSGLAPPGEARNSALQPDLPSPAVHSEPAQPAPHPPPAPTKTAAATPTPAAPAPSPASIRQTSGRAMSATEIGSAIETLASLRDKGILTDEEFTAKKTELLGRL